MNQKVFILRGWLILLWIENFVVVKLSCEENYDLIVQTIMARERGLFKENLKLF